MIVPNTLAWQDCTEMVYPSLQSGVLRCEKNSCTWLARTLPFPLPADKNPIKLPCWWPFRENVCSRAWTHTSLFFDQRRKISFASGLNSVSLYWLKPNQAWGPLLRMDTGVEGRELGLLHWEWFLPPEREEEGETARAPGSSPTWGQNYPPAFSVL